MNDQQRAAIAAEMTRRGLVVASDDGGEFWTRELSDGTSVAVCFANNQAFGAPDEWEWYVAHCDAKGEEIGGGDGDLAWSLEAVDGYIAEPGWDRQR